MDVVRFGTRARGGSSSVVALAWLDDNARKATKRAIDVKRLVSGPRSALASTHRSVLADPNDNGRAADKRCWVVELNSAGDVGCSSVPQAVKSGKAAVYVYRSPPPKSTRAERWFISSFTELLEWKWNRH